MIMTNLSIVMVTSFKSYPVRIPSKGSNVFLHLGDGTNIIFLEFSDLFSKYSLYTHFSAAN